MRNKKFDASTAFIIELPIHLLYFEYKVINRQTYFDQTRKNVRQIFKTFYKNLATITELGATAIFF